MTTALRYALYTILAIWGLITFIALASEAEDLTVFCTVKAIALASLYLLYRAGCYLYNRGLLCKGEEDDE